MVLAYTIAQTLTFPKDNLPKYFVSPIHKRPYLAQIVIDIFFISKGNLPFEYVFWSIILSFHFQPYRIDCTLHYRIQTDTSMWNLWNMLNAYNSS